MTIAIFSDPRTKPKKRFSKLYAGNLDPGSYPTQSDYPDITGSYVPEWITSGSAVPEIYQTPSSGLRQGTTHSPIKVDEIFLLEIVAERQDERAFIMAADFIDWTTRSAEDHTIAVRLALSSGAHMKARHLAKEGAVRYPEHEELQKMARILAPPQIISNNLPSKPGAGADMAWLKEHGDQYRSQWVALKDGELLANANSFAEIIEIVGNPRGKGILVTKVY